MPAQQDQTEQGRGLLPPPHQTPSDPDQPLTGQAAPQPPAERGGEPATFATVPVSLLGAAQERLSPPPEQPQAQRTAKARQQLDDIRRSALDSASWLETTHHYARLLNRDGYVPVTARFRSRDLAFLGQARQDLIGFADLTLRLVELHQPLDAGGISSDPASPVLRCRSCMWRWPCPSLRLILDELDAMSGRQAG